MGSRAAFLVLSGVTILSRNHLASARLAAARLAMAGLAVAWLGCGATPGLRDGARGRDGDASTSNSSPPLKPHPSAADFELGRIRQGMLSQRGVIAVRLDDTGNGIVVELCAVEARATLDLSGVGVPISAVVSDAPNLTALGKPCGCSSGGKYYESGESYLAAPPHQCNSCRCTSQTSSACTLLDCRIQILDRIHFDAGSATLPATTYALLDEIGAALREHREIVIAIHGHASKGEPGAERLSRSRAEAVASYLTTHGLAAGRIERVDGLGATAPRNKDGSKDDRAQNRRVELEVITADPPGPTGTAPGPPGAR